MTAVERSHAQQTVRSDRRLVAGRYRLNARIGRGRIGDIYEADDERYRDVSGTQRVAIQLLPGRIALNNALFNKLKSGYAVIRAACHPNIVPYFDVGYDGRFGYLVMDCLDGASLRLILDDATTVPLDEVNPVVRAVGKALQFLHANSIAHGQLTAENVFITEDCKVRLLDVVPLDSASTTLRGVTSEDSFSRCDIGDDVYGLGCLAYEMLAGEHPFNFLALADARNAGIELARIETLPDKQWHALARALSLDDEQRTSTVADFLHEFDVTDTERVPASYDAPIEPIEPIEPIAEPDTGHAKPKSTGRWPSPILIVFLVGFGTWFVYGQPRDDLVTLTDYVASYLDSGSAGSEDSSLPISVIKPTPVQPSVPTAVDASQITEGAVGEAATLLTEEPSATEEPLVTDEPLVTEEPSVTEEQSAAELTPIPSFVTVSERDGGARVNARRPANTAGPVFWWTGDNTAIADRDYIAVEPPVEAFTSGEEFESLRIPLINDSLPETQETFFVYLGQYDAVSGRLEPILRIQVDISDDE